MPKVTVYIRNGDVGMWKALDAKAEAIHTMLVSQNKPLLRPRLDVRVINKGDDDYQFCKHDAVKGYCKQGCK